MNINDSEEPTETVGFTLETAEGNIFTVPDTKYPLWHGPYHEGTLTIYRAEVSGIATTDILVAFISVYADSKSKEDFVACDCYPYEVETNSIVRDIQNNVFDKYCKIKADSAINAAVESSKNQTLH